MLTNDKMDPQAISAFLGDTTASLASSFRNDFPSLESQAETHDLVQETMDKETSAMTASQAKGFSDLPAELRNHVYELVMESGEICVQDRRVLRCGRPVHTGNWYRGPPPRYGQANRSNIISPPITRVCRQMRQESLPLFYGQTTFVAYIDLDDLPKFQGLETSHIRDWLDMVGDDASNMVKNLTIRVPLPRKCVMTGGRCERPKRHWHPTSAADIVDVLKLDLKDSAIKIELGATVEGTFWWDAVRSVDDYKKLEWKKIGEFGDYEEDGGEFSD